VGWRESYQITMAGLAATRLFAAAGAGGVALTAWALRRSGLEARLVAARMVAFLVLLYSVYALAVVVGGLGLHFGLFNGPAPFGITVVPAIAAALALVLLYSAALVPEDFDRRFAARAEGAGRLRRLLGRVAAAPAAVAAGVRLAVGLVASRSWGVLGGALWWGFDIATLWAAFHAFGADPPPAAVIVVAYFVGMLGNALPLPGGVGGVDGGMIGALVVFGVDFGLAAVSVLAYRAFSFWLPTAPGAVAYVQLRRTVRAWAAEGRTARPAAGPAAL
jgi:uncharacterized protein (TIRG00374 family)